ncbi:PAS domain S-box protein, partial [bacterium]|nr:PAS domain S-box protein [bacterium]
EQARLRWEETRRGRALFLMNGRLWCQATKSYRSFEAKAVPLRNRDGSIREWVGTLVDVDERRKAEEEQQKFKFLADNANDAYLLANRSSEIVYANPVACELLGYTHEELLGLSLSRIERDHDRSRFDQLFAQPAGTRIPPFESSYDKRDGGSVPVEISVSRLNYLGDEFIFAVARDITERRAVEQSLRMHAEELARSNRELEQFAYVSSHDLKEPLRMVTVYVQMLQNHLSGKLDDQAAEYLNYAVQGSRRMLALINDLLSYSRLSKEVAPFTSVSCGEGIQTAVQNLRAAIEETGAQIDIAPLPRVLGIQSQISQLFQNLISNALKFRADRPPLISVTAKEDGEFWVFSVIDNGIGIQPRYLDRIFVIFQRLHTAQKYPGTGIGLSICKKIVENHGGRIWVESSIGNGSAFHFTLPRAVATAQPVATPLRKEIVYASVPAAH